MIKKNSTPELSALINTITDTLAKNKGVRLISFGSFNVNHRAARQCRNPQTGNSMTISARNHPAL